MRDQLTAAIEQRKIVTFTYGGYSRRVQPAAFGVGKRKGKETLHAYQIGGESKSGGVPHWRNFRVESIQSLTVLDEVFGPNPPGFKGAPFPQTQVALTGGTAPSAPKPSGGSGGGDAKKADQIIPGVPISGEQAAKAAEVASQALGKLSKWFKKR